MKRASEPNIPEHLESSFNLIEERNGGRAAMAWLRSKTTPQPIPRKAVSDSIRAHSLRAAIGSPELDAVRSACPFPRISTRKTETGPRKIPSLFNQSPK